MKRVNVYIDGFNVYHVLKKQIKHGEPKRESKLKWCDLKSLAESYLEKGEELGDIYFFTADSWIKKTRVKGSIYQKALNQSGVTIVKGEYNSITKTFFHKMKIKKVILKFPCFKKLTKFFIPKIIKYKTYEEKRTDVNIAVKIVEDAFLKKYDRAMIMSGDSDIAPAVETVKRNFPKISFATLWINGTKGQLIRGKCDTHYIIGYKKWKSHIFPNTMKTSKGEILEMPTERS